MGSYSNGKSAHTNKGILRVLKAQHNRRIGSEILAAAGGGVDPAVAACAVEAGHEVIGVHLAYPACRHPAHRLPRLLHSKNSMDARRVSAPKLGIPFVWDFSERFKEDVVDDFISGIRSRTNSQPLHALQRKD